MTANGNADVISNVMVEIEDSKQYSTWLFLNEITEWVC